MQDHLLSIVTRLHTVEGQALPLLGRMLLSIAGSSYAPVQPLIITQCFTAEELQTVRDLAADFVWPEGLEPRIVNYASEIHGDHRTALLNLGIQSAPGRFLALLDYDDYVYEHAYETLIARLKNGPAAVAFGGCRAAYAAPVPGGYKITGKDAPWSGKTQDDFFTDNIFPPVSYVIDRHKLGGPVPLIDERLTRLEDYYLLLKLRAQAPFDMACFDTPLCEYVIRKDGTTTFQLGDVLDTSANRDAWETSRRLIAPLLLSLQPLRGKPDETLRTSIA